MGLRLPFIRLGVGWSRLLASIAAVGSAASIAGLGTFATFTSSTPPAPQTLESGTLTVSLGAPDASTNRLGVGASAIAAGDSIERALDLSYSGSVSFQGISLTTSASPSSALDSDTTSGQRLAIDECSVPWTESGPPYTYTCSGSTSSVLAPGPVINTDASLSNLSLTSGSTDHLRVMLTLPSEAGNELQNQASTISYTFTGSQRESSAG